MSALIAKYKITLLVLVAIVIVLGFLTYQFIGVGGAFSNLKNDLKQIEPEEGSSYQNLNGENLSLNTYRGDVLVVNSWATWSPYSKDELKALERIQQKYGEKISVLAINRKETAQLIRAYLQNFGISESSIVYLTDVSDHFYTTSGGYAMPETIVYRKDGTIATHIRGVLNETDLQSVIDSVFD